MINIFNDKSIHINKPIDIDDKKKYCVLGVLKTELGITIKDEMLKWLKPTYNVYIIEQEPPGIYFEYPALLFMKQLQLETKKPCLYLHTKGAAHDNFSQKYVRLLWKDEFINHIDEYFQMINTNIPTIACPFTGPEKITWLNGMIFNYEAAKTIEIPLPKYRYYYEQLCRISVSKNNYNNINVIGRIYNDVNIGKTDIEQTAGRRKAAAYMKLFYK